MAVSVLLDARKLGDSGIGVYIENLVMGLVELKRRGCIELDLSLLVSPFFLESGAPIWVQELVARLDDQANLIPEPAGKYTFSEYFLLAGRQRGVLNEVDLYHSPHFTLPFFLKVPSVVTIHDVIHVTRPENMRHRLFAKALISSAVNRANHIISVSEGSAKLLVDVLGYFKTPVTVTANALQQGFEVLPRSEIQRFLSRQPFHHQDYCLFVGNERPHKGFKELIEAWQILKNDGHLEPLPKLVLVGERYSALAKQLVADCGLSDQVHFVGWQSKESLVYLYNGAAAVIAPSKEEGFGLVGLEAMGCGVPVICTPHASFQEVCGDCAWYSEDFGAVSLAAVIRYALNAQELCRAKVEQGLQRVQRFTRESSARATCEVYQRVLLEQREHGADSVTAPSVTAPGEKEKVCIIKDTDAISNKDCNHSERLAAALSSR